MQITRFGFLILTMLYSAVCGEPGAVCIAPISWKPLGYSAPGLYCDAGKIALKIDSQSVPAPIKTSVKVSPLDVSSRHRVVVLCDGKPQQSFTFRFTEFKSNELCLFVNDLYKTAQLQDAKRCPWCKCK